MPKVNHRNTEQHTFSHSTVYNKYFINFLGYYAIVNIFFSLLVLKTPWFYVTKYLAKLNVAYQNINLIFSCTLNYCLIWKYYISSIVY